MLIKPKEIEATDIKKLLLKVYKKYQSGHITEVQAHKEAYLLNSILKVIEVVDLEKRLQLIENTLKNG
jgi:hypothetical protein